MQDYIRRLGRPFGGIALSFAAGIIVGYGIQPAVAVGPEKNLSIGALSEQVAGNSSRIASLERQLQGADSRIDTLDRKVESNRDATRSLATRSGVQIQFRD